MFPDTEFTKRSPSDPADLPITLEQAAQLIASAGGACRFLPAQFIQLQPSDAIVPAEAIIFYFVMTGVLVLNSLGVSFARTDGAGAVVLLAAWIGSIVFLSYIMDAGGKPLEPNKSALDTLSAVPNSLVHLSPYPARVEDNPLATLSGFPFSTIFSVMRHFGIYHQKLAIVRTTSTGFYGYCGGVDVNPDRLDTADHLNRSPFHDLHARIEGPAVRDLALSFEERWTHDAPTEALAFATPDAVDLGTPGTDIVQVARTYFRPHGTGAGSRAFSFAPDGDRTIGDTMLKGIASAREFIYIEDQYFTPPQNYHDALVQKVIDGQIRKLMIAMPGITDQPFGELVRSQLITDLRAADAGRGIVQIGYPRRHFTLPENDIRASSGKCILNEDMASSSGFDPTIVLKPKERVPTPPFWVSVDGELMWVYDESTTPSAEPATSRRYMVDRGPITRLVKGGSSPEGPEMREHKKNTAATIVELSGIYVHAKMMIVDDVFLGVGSANLNRRGLFHDGEINIFTVPQALKTRVDNPIAMLRRKLWAEMLNLPAEMASPLLQDPAAAANLFKRSGLSGNRYVDIEAYPTHIMFGATTGDGIVGNVLHGAGFTIVAAEHIQLFNTVVDPTS
jgi:phosphatidylserine/phosphatidylglycerophosphate/cardiolipin synthase-like enzyme